MKTKAEPTEKVECGRCGSLFNSPQVGTAAVSLITKTLKAPTIEELETILDQESESHTLPSGEVLAKKDVLIDYTTTACGTCIAGLQNRIQATLDAWEKDKPEPDQEPDKTCLGSGVGKGPH